MCLVNEKVLCLNQAFPISTLLTFGGWIILCCGVRPVPCRAFCSIPGFYPLGVRSIFPPVMTATCQISPGGQNGPQVRTIGFDKCPSMSLFFLLLQLYIWDFETSQILHSHYRELKKKQHKGERTKTVHDSQC